MSAFIFTLIFVEVSIFVGVASLVVSSIFMKLNSPRPAAVRAISRNRFRQRRLECGYIGTL